MISFFFKKKPKYYGDIIPLTIDMHSHLLPGIDDGCQRIEESIFLVKKFVEMGYKKLITTPHVMGDFYQNTPEIIFSKLEELRNAIRKENISIELDAAAEYYLDESFVARIERGEKLLCFGEKRYVLFETSYINPSPYLEHVIFGLQSLGYTPILAHPERYIYIFDDFQRLKAVFERGVLFQININSLSGYYSSQSKKVAEKLIDNKMVHFLASDCHGERHMKVTQKTRESEYYKKAVSIGLFNNTL